LIPTVPVQVLPDEKKEPPMSDNVKLELLDPRGEIEIIKKYGLAKRVTDLAGKRIALVHNQKAGASTFLDAVEELLKEKFPTATFVKGYTTTINLAKEPEFYDEVAKNADVFIFGAGD
jgi:hypothetical protein